jgi:hypothetical protein
LVNASATIKDDTSSAIGVFWIQVDNTTCDATFENLLSVVHGYSTIDQPGGWQGMALTGVALVTEGDHTLTFCGRENTVAGAGGDTIVISPSMTAIFSIAVEYDYLPASEPALSGPVPRSTAE